MKFSAVIITKNEEKTLPNLLTSLKGVEDIVILDTGSNDKTIKIAKEFGCNVIEVGSKFLETPTNNSIKKFKNFFGFYPSFTIESKLFNYAAARNYALTFAKND